MDTKAAKLALGALGVNRLLAEPDHNPKLAKSLKLRVLTRPLHLAPAKLSGFEVCAMRTAGCTLACLHTAGNPAFMKGKARARIARTRAYFTAREAFMVALVAEVERHEKQARAMRYRAGVRLNATSDIVWESVPCTRNGKAYSNIMEAFPRVQFYDYTKRHNRRNLPKNYHLTYSLAENNDQQAVEWLLGGGSVAAVFSVTPKQALPASYDLGGLTFSVIDGDIHDFRPIDPGRVIVGLRAKGKARRDTSGFVRKIM
jgi:hypothetical protein